MDIESVKTMWVVMWNFEDGSFWLGTIEQALASGMSRYEGRAFLTTPKEKFDDQFSQSVHKAYRWIWLGIVPTQKEAREFIIKLQRERA